MYITETTENVRKLMDEIEKTNDINKLKFLIYVFGLLNNNQINDKNDANPILMNDDNIEIFTLSLIGFDENTCTIFLQNLVMAYNILTKSNNAYEENGNAFGLSLNETDKKISSNFEKLKFNEKLDVFREIFIKLENESFFDNKYHMITLSGNGFNIASNITKLKKK